jgi:double-stranded uracil-DNA glycosylase
MSRVQSFPPIVSQQSKLLILGSMPGEASLKAGQYYAHPRNAFWHIMGELFGAGPSLPYQERVTILESVGVALWDSLQACIRPGSLDALIKEEVANDFPALFAKYPNITHVFFNGSKAEIRAPAIDQPRPCLGPQQMTSYDAGIGRTLTWIASRTDDEA